jgi:hypothetical protein
MYVMMCSSSYSGWSGWRYVSERLKLCAAENYSNA